MINTYVMLVILCFSSTYHGVTGLRKTKSLFVECIDIYKQPTLQHPLLQNHSIQMEPSFKMERDPRITLRYNKGETLGFFKDNVCPNGSVPIQRIQGGVTQPLTLNYPGQHFATLSIGPHPEYRGGIAYMTIEQPSVEPNQFTGGLIWIKNGPPTEINTISIGWMVNPKLYGDNISRITGFWTGNGYKNGCYNILCPGFVQIDQHKYLGHDFGDLSPIGPTKIFESQFSVVKDQVSGNWWLMLFHYKIGYWPKEIFTHLNKEAISISFGGVAYAPIGQSSPRMGRGTFASYYNIYRSAVFETIQTVDQNYHVINFDYSKSTAFVDSKKCYSLVHWKYDQKYGETFTYGGPGGNNCGI